jgi:host factor-I protein
MHCGTKLASHVSVVTCPFMLHRTVFSDNKLMPPSPPVDISAIPHGERIQEPFLNNLRKLRRTVVIYLVNGVKLAGKISSFDQHTVALEGHDKQVINKHAIATIMPAPPRPAIRKPRDPNVVRRNHFGLPIKQ